MASYVLKCKSCNIVINELLAFVQNKMDVMVDESLVQICATAFSDDEIEKAKNLLFESVSKQKTTRRRDGKTQRNLDDIICLLRETDPEEMPIFVARDLGKLPPVTFDHVDVTRLLKDIVLIQRELGDMQQKCAEAAETEYVTIHQFQQLQSEINEMKRQCIVSNVNTKRGAFCLEDSYQNNSGPMGFLAVSETHQHDASSKSSSSSPEGMPTEKSHSQTTEACGPLSLSFASVVAETAAAPAQPANSRVEAGISTAVSNNQPVDAAGEALARSQTLSESAVGNNNKEQCQSEQDGWITVEKRKSKCRFVGRKGRAPVDPTSKFKAAAPKIPLFIYNVSLESSEVDVAEYIKAKTEIVVSPVRVGMKEEKEYNSYKIYIPKDKLPVFYNDDLWPDGIFFRRYFIFSRTAIKDTDKLSASRRN